ncbi:kinase-like domain-containing protein [Rhizophagus irregularis DAOM 181602=DAOM 197198]|nr:kinase-like domain-containing protein [Rhizophagus irregularis DAOM 181602=DAOM 197198]
MTEIRYELAVAAINRAMTLIDNNIHDNLDKKSGCSEIFIADWIEGRYNEWDLKEKQLKRVGKRQVILKGLENIEKANRNWFDEAKSHITISNKWDNVVGCFGITQNPSNDNYMLVVQLMDTDLEKYLQQNNQELTWKKRIQIVQHIIYALSRIHGENAIHRDLHSGNILFLHLNQSFYISDLGFCGPANVPINGTYGKLPYIAPEAIVGNKTTFESDIYSIGILMWEISSGTPLEYKILMEQCWDADPAKRPDINSLYDKISEIKNSYNQEHHETFSHANVTNFSYTKSISKVHMYDNLPEPRNATEEEQEVYDSTQYDFIIPDDISDD